MIKNSGTVRIGRDEAVLHTIAYVFVSIVAVSCLLPFILVVSASFSSESAILKNGFSFFRRTLELKRTGRYSISRM